MSQIAVRAHISAAGLVLLEPKTQLVARHGVRLTNEVADVRPGKSFDVIIGNFTKHSRRLPKGTTVFYALPNPLAILEPERKLSQGIAAALRISSFQGLSKPSTAPDAHGDAEKEATDDNGQPSSDWREKIYLSSVGDLKIRERVIEMLTKHK